jgi:hypothetical protein
VRQEFEVSVQELLGTLQRRGIPLASEMGAFITLEVCEQIIDRPIHVSAHEVAINEIGEVLCGSQPTPTDEEDAVRSLLVLLGDLLVCAAPGVPSMLLELVERGPNAPELTLDLLRDELEACLVPLNRGATRRVLARLLREARKVGPNSRAGAQPTAADIDAQFDALLASSPGTESAVDAAVSMPRTGFAEPALSASARRPAPSRRFDETPVTEPLPALERPTPRARDKALVDDDAKPRSRATSARPAQSARETALARNQVDAVEPQGEPEQPPVRLSLTRSAEPAASRRSRDPDIDGLIEAGQRRSSVGTWLFAGCLVAALSLVGVYLALGRAGTRSALGLLPTADSAPPPLAAVPVHKQSVGELHVNSNPPRAQVFLLIGPGPAVATDLQLGVAQEFVALAEGYAPARAIVPADASWEEVDGKPRYELAIQAPRSTVEPGKMNLGKTLLPQDVGTAKGRLGSVRIVTTPRGAKVYQLVGFTPDVRIENLPLDQSYEILVSLEGRAVVTRQLTAADFAELEGKRSAQLEIELPAVKH